MSYSRNWTPYDEQMMSEGRRMGSNGQWRTRPGAPQAAVSSGLDTSGTGLTPKPEWDAQFKPKWGGSPANTAPVATPSVPVSSASIGVLKSDAPSGAPISSGDWLDSVIAGHAEALQKRGIPVNTSSLGTSVTGGERTASGAIISKYGYGYATPISNYTPGKTYTSSIGDENGITTRKWQRPFFNS